MPVLEARGIVKTLGVGRAQRRVLAGADLEVAAGEVVAVLGRSGSGKSTLLHLLGGLDHPDQGRIVLAGREITKQSPRALAKTRLRHVGFVFQSFHLIEELSGEENVLLPARLPGAGRDGERRGRRLIGELGLTEIAALAGHTHRNSIEARGHYWLINTASLIDYPQQARALRVVATAGGGVAIQTWMLDHTGSELGTISRQLAYLDAHGGRPKGFAGDAPGPQRDAVPRVIRHSPPRAR